METGQICTNPEPDERTLLICETELKRHLATPLVALVMACAFGDDLLQALRREQALRGPARVSMSSGAVSTVR